MPNPKDPDDSADDSAYWERIKWDLRRHERDLWRAEGRRLGSLLLKEGAPKAFSRPLTASYMRSPGEICLEARGKEGRR